MFRSSKSALWAVVVAFSGLESAHSGGNGALKKTSQEIVDENTWRCRVKLGDSELGRMEERLIRREIPGPRYGVFFPGQDYICVLIKFDISDTGEPINFETIDYWPTNRYERAGYQALIQYKFTPAKKTEVDGPFYELFELTGGVDPELDISKLPDLPELPGQEEERGL